MAEQKDLKDITIGAGMIYFVCSGNIIRSSFAELYARHLGIRNVDSYGTTYHNSKIHQRSAEKLQTRGVEEELIRSFVPKHIDEISEFKEDDLHIIMTEKHLTDLRTYGIPENRILYITEYLGTIEDVADPYFAGNYDQAYATISAAVEQMITFFS